MKLISIAQVRTQMHSGKQLPWNVRDADGALLLARGHLVETLTERNVDQLICLIIRHDHTRFAMYGSAHSLHVATVCSLLARRLGWPQEQHERLLCAALTMN